MKKEDVENSYIVLSAYAVGALASAIIVSCLVSFFIGVVIGWLIK